MLSNTEQYSDLQILKITTLGVELESVGGMEVGNFVTSLVGFDLNFNERNELATFIFSRTGRGDNNLDWLKNLYSEVLNMNNQSQ